MKRFKLFIHEKIFPMASWLPRYYILFRWGRFAPQDRVLDIGCGEGIVSLKLATRCREVIGLDISPENIRRADERRSFYPKITNLSFMEGDILKLPFADSSFDRAIFLDALPEIKEDVAALKEIARVLKPGGSLLITAAVSYPADAKLFFSQRLLRRFIPRFLKRPFLPDGTCWLDATTENVGKKLRISQNYTLEHLQQKAVPYLSVHRFTYVLKVFGALATDITYGIKGFWPLRFLFFWPAVRLDYYLFKRSPGYTLAAELKKP